MSKRRAPEDPLIRVNLFLFYKKDGVDMVNVDTSSSDVWRNQFCDDKSLNQTLDWLLNGINNHVRGAYYKIPDKEQEYVFFVNVGVQDSEMPGVKTDASATFDVFWARAQHCYANEFSESASMRLSIGQALGALSDANVPPFISLCPDIIPNFGAEAVQHIRLHKLRSPKATAIAPYARMTLSTERKQAILAERTHSVYGLYGARPQTIISIDEAMPEACRPKLTMEEAIAAGPDARMTLSTERKRSILAELHGEPTYTFDSSIGDGRMVSAATVKPVLGHKPESYMRAIDEANPHVQAVIAQRSAHLQRTAEYTPEQQEEIWAARLMAGSDGHNLLRRLKLPSHLLR